MEYRIGQSQDTHKLVADRKLILGGVVIPHDKGLLGHSDADVLLHVVCESILGALGLGDLGTFFPDTDLKWKDIDSSVLVKEVVTIMEEHKYYVNNIDCTIFLERPILRPYMAKIQAHIAKLLKVDNTQVNVKATRGEGLGFIGREEGIQAQCVVLLRKMPSKKLL